METISVRTTQNIDIEYEIGGLGERILALLLDYGIFLGFAFVGIILLASLPGMGSKIFLILIGVMFVFYDLLCEVFFNGQSLGKRVMKIRVISLNGARPKFSQYLLRWLFRLVDFGITSGICALVTTVMTENGQRVGDLVAGTVLIKTHPRSQMNNIVFVNTGNEYQPTFLQASQLTDKDIGLIHEIIDNYMKTGNNQLVYTMADKMRQLLEVNLPPNMNSMQFLQTIIKDYSYLTAQTEIV